MTESNSSNVSDLPSIAIVGGGLVGMSLALMLSKQLNSVQQNVAITLIEKFVAPAPKVSNESQKTKPVLKEYFDSRSTALSAGSAKLFDQFDSWQLVKENAEEIRHIHISDRGHYGSTLLHAEDHSVDALGYVLENSWLGQCLYHQLQWHDDITFLAPANVESCQMQQQGAVLTLCDGEQIRKLQVDLLIIADGADSALCHSLGIDSTTKHYQQSAIVTNVALAKPHNGFAFERFTSQGPLALLPLSDCDGLHRAAIVWTRDSDQVDALMSLSDGDFLAKLQQCFGYRADHFVHVGQRQSYALQLVQSTEQVRSRVVVMGNAAHFLHPVAGQGFNLSLRDCASLVNVLHEAYMNKQALGDYKTLKRYEVARERDQQITIGLTDAMVKTFSTQQASLSIFRQMGLLGLQVVPSAKKTLAQQFMGMT